jgi:hypothetical protein
MTFLKIDCRKPRQSPKPEAAGSEPQPAGGVALLVGQPQKVGGEFQGSMLRYLFLATLANIGRKVAIFLNPDIFQHKKLHLFLIMDSKISPNFFC